MKPLQYLRWGMGFVWWRWCRGPLWTLQARAALRLWGAEVGKGLRVHGPLRIHNEGSLVIGKGVQIMSAGVGNFVGGDRRMAIWVGRGGRLELGDGCGMSNSTIVCLRSVTILPGTFIGGGCEIYDSDLHQLDPEDRLLGRGEVPAAPVRIGPKAFVGAFAIVLKGVTIGEGAVIGAGSVVTKPVGPYEIWAGAPARFIRKLGSVRSADGRSGA
jgi:acetyltransferase-like isoleucine patch superfamily enzyme